MYVLGSIPLLLATGPGSHSRNQIGLVISTGMLFGTLFTLIILPTLYSMIQKKI
ncbi:efflux RND transporter permease subunit [Facilibium subflavum]|uniref:efflux RND transporter permease subunit n=1 Tax=Facilibium subflavum TaxID=2219058 RepID=UPI0013C32C21|nr:efflux RND transporter permease subunit [Facilibium subflavum]